MPDYEYGKIYEIVSPSTGLRYVGSTVQTLSLRMAGHRRGYKRWLKKNYKKFIKLIYNSHSSPLVSCLLSSNRLELF